MKLYKMSNTVVNLRTKEEYFEYIKMCEDVGWVWSSHKKPKGFFCWNDYKEKTCITIKDEFMYEKELFYKEIGNKIITLSELKRRLNMWKAGDIIADGSRERKVLAVCGEIVAVSYDREFNKFSRWELEKELEEQGYKLKTDDEVKDAIEVLEKAGKIKDGKIINY